MGGLMFYRKVGICVFFFRRYFGEPGRNIVKNGIPHLVNEFRPHFVIANGENAAHGAGITYEIALELDSYGIDAITGGNHIFDKKVLWEKFDVLPYLLRPANYPEGALGKGYVILRKKDFEKLNFDELQKEYNISVVIPARNEEVNIGKILSALLNQSIKVNEIIVVNDNSSDKTAEIVEHFSKLDNRVRLINLLQEPPDGWIGKSWALWNGVLNSSGDLLILFDADVEPNKVDYR